MGYTIYPVREEREIQVKFDHSNRTKPGWDAAIYVNGSFLVETAFLTYHKDNGFWAFNKARIAYSRESGPDRSIEWLTVSKDDPIAYPWLLTLITKGAQL